MAGCYGTYQVKADHPTGAGTLMPTVEDRDAGLVGIAGGFDLKGYPVIAISLFPVTDLAVKDDGDRRTAASMSAFFRSELLRRMRESGLFTRVVNLTETPWQPGAEKALRLDGRITRLGEGSQAARAFAGLYGAGKARAQNNMVFTDAQTGRPAIVTADRRVARMGFFGGDNGARSRQVPRTAEPRRGPKKRVSAPAEPLLRTGRRRYSSGRPWTSSPPPARAS